MKAWLTVRLVTAALAAAACSSPSPTGGTLPPDPPVVRIALEDNRLDHAVLIPAGRVVFQARNVGKVLHNLVLLPLDESLPPFDEQLRGKERRTVPPFAAMRPVRPGEVGEFAVDLIAGQRYGMFCSIVDAEGKSHAVKGMNAEFRAGGSGAKRQAQDSSDG